MKLDKRADVHGHYFPPAYQEMLDRHHMTFLDSAPRPAWSEEIQLSYMERLNISYSVLSISSPHLHMGDPVEAIQVAKACNEYGASLKRMHPGKFAIMASLPLPEIDASVAEIRYCHDKLKTDGFALQTHSLGVYLGNPVLDPVMEELNRLKSVAVIHPTQPASVPAHVGDKLPAALMEYFFDTTRAVTNMILQGTIHRYPDIRFIIPHAGAFLPVLSDRLQALSGTLNLGNGLDIMGDLANLYYDLAGIAMPKQYRLLKEITNDSHILYGSDEPFTPLPLCTRLAEEMDGALTGTMAEQIYRKNPLALFPDAAISLTAGESCREQTI